MPLPWGSLKSYSVTAMHWGSSGMEGKQLDIKSLLVHLLVVDVVCWAASACLKAATTEAKKARGRHVWNASRMQWAPNIVCRRKRNLWVSTHCQSGQLQEKPAVRLLFVLRRDMMRVKTTCRLMAKTKATIKNPQWFARRQKLVGYDQQAKLQCNLMLAKEHTRSPVIPSGLPHRSRTGVGEDRWPTHLSLTLPKWNLTHI